MFKICDRDDAGIYCPVSLIFTICKIMERYKKMKQCTNSIWLMSNLSFCMASCSSDIFPTSCFISDGECNKAIGEWKHCLHRFFWIIKKHLTLLTSEYFVKRCFYLELKLPQKNELKIWFWISQIVVSWGMSFPLMASYAVIFYKRLSLYHFLSILHS